jgi:autoinducer 2-degrading protein
MIVRAVTVWVKPDQCEAFEEATRHNHLGSIAEPGVVRFDVLRDENDPGVYMLYEMYVSEEAALLHKETDHYKTWRAAVEPMMARARSGWALTVLHPAEA